MDKNKATLELGTKPVGQLLVQYALPAIIASESDGSWQTVRQFGYEDFKMRL